MISYLQVENLSKRFGENLLFENISFGIGKDQRVALIAKNGTGKTTLLNIIAGLDSPDSGLVTFRNDLKVAYLHQNPYFDDSHTVLEHVLSSSNEVIKVIRDYEHALATNNKAALQTTMELMEQKQAWDYEAKIKQILSQLAITDFEQQVSQLSGGQKKRVALANVLIEEPDILILDEPTNHLDMDMIEWLETYLLKSKMTLLMVTHDRYFLDRVCDEIIEMDDNKIFTYKGNYSYYVEKREERLEITNATIERAKSLLRSEREWMVRSPQARGTKAKARVDNYYKIEEAANQKISKDKIGLDIKTTRLGNKILDMYNITKRFENRTMVDDFNQKFQKNQKIGIVGPNGCGKSTLLNIICGDLKQDSGTIDVGETVVFGYYKQAGIKLDKEKRVIEVIKDIAEVITLGGGRKLSATQFLDYFLFTGDTQYSYVSKLSGGEMRRLYLMTILMQNPNFLILDEPTNDLDIVTLNVLEEYLTNFDGCSLIVSHDRFFLDKVVDTVLVFEGDGKIKHYPGNYSYYKSLKDERDRDERVQQKALKDTSDSKNKKEPEKKNPKKMTFNDKREYEKLGIELQELEKQKQTLEVEINSGNLKPEFLIEKTSLFSKLLETIDEKELRWLELDELN